MHIQNVYTISTQRKNENFLKAQTDWFVSGVNTITSHPTVSVDPLGYIHSKKDIVNDQKVVCKSNKIEHAPIIMEQYVSA